VITDLTISILMLAVGGYGVIEMSQLPPMRGGGVGPAFYPLGLSLILIVLSVILIARTLIAFRINKATNISPNTTMISVQDKHITDTEMIRPIVLLGSTVVYVFLFETIGFFILTVAIVTLLTYVLSPERLMRKLGFSVAFTVLAWLVFRTFLRLPLPAGILGIF
jgi:hypothetical protein